MSFYRKIFNSKIMYATVCDTPNNFVICETPWNSC